MTSGRIYVKFASMTLRLQRRFGPWILHHAFEFKWFYLGAFFFLYVLQVLQSQIPERIRELTIHMGEGNIGNASIYVFLGLALGILIFRTGSRLLFFYPARVQQKLLRMELLGLLESVTPDRYASRSQGQTFQVLFDDINNIRGFIGFGLLQVGNIIIAAWVLIPKVNESDSYLWPAFIPLLSSLVLQTSVTLINQRYFKKMADKKGEVQQYIIEAYEAKQTIKNFHREDNFINGFLKLSKEELSIFFKASIGFAISGPYVKLGLGFSLLWAGYLIKANGGGPSDLVFFSGFLYLFLEPVMFLSWVAIVISQGFAAWKRIKELYFVLIKPSELENELTGIKFEDGQNLEVTFKFWDRPLDLKVVKSRWTIFIGETGSGKTYLLTKLATTMILKGTKVSMVQQEPYLFNDTIQENIFLGKATTIEELTKAKELLRMFQLDSLENNLDNVLALEVGENGKRLSGGQMKRVALIRSLMSGADTIFWDDPFSSVDIILEKKIILALQNTPMWSQKTFIISSHRLTTVRLSQEVIYLDKDNGIKLSGHMREVLQDSYVAQFFKEQMVDLSLA